MSDAKISGGYVILARKTFDSDIMNQPPLYFKLWAWMLDRANWKDREKLKRGQFVATGPEMQEAMSWMKGCCKKKPSKDEIRSAYEAFTKAAMITTAKTTRGMIVTICNYDLYQNPANYEARSEAHGETSMKPTGTPQDTEEGKEEKKEKKPLADYSAEFESFWSMYPKKVGKDAAYKSWKKTKPSSDTVSSILSAISWQIQSADWTKESGQFIPHPSTYLNGGRWKDDPTPPPPPAQTDTTYYVSDKVRATYLKMVEDGEIDPPKIKPFVPRDPHYVSEKNKASFLEMRAAGEI
jgi:hypothetical protein